MAGYVIKCNVKGVRFLDSENLRFFFMKKNLRFSES